MSEEDLPELETPAETENQNEQLSNTEAMSGVITAPGETYETIANTPKKNYWILPVIIFIIVNLVATFLFMSDKELVDKTMEKQKEAMREQFDKNVKEGKMTQEDANKAMESMNPAGIFFKALAFGGAVIGPIIMLLLLSVVYLLGLKIMKAQFDFTNVLNVVGLALLIVAIGNLISIVISVLKGDMTTVGPGLLFNEESVGKKVYGLLTKLDVFSLWFYIVVAIGLAKISRIEVVKTVSLVFGVWIVYIVITSFLV